MQPGLYSRLLAGLLLVLPAVSAAVVDRVAIVIDKKVITESEVLDELRLTEFINNEPLDLGPAARRAAAERLVDQEFIRRDVEVSGFAQPSPAEADTVLRKFREEHFPSADAYSAALQKYEIAEDQLKQHLLWQLTAIRFTDLRFRPIQAETASQSADRATQSSDGASNSAAATVDQQMEAWLKQARSTSKVTFKPEAFK
jgi:hypothetical protein